MLQRHTKGKLKISRRRKDQLFVSFQVVTDPCCGLSVIFCGFISHLTGRETINIPAIFSGVLTPCCVDDDDDDYFLTIKYLFIL